MISPAKINLHLSILDQRADGFHNLWMLMTKISLCDEIILEKIPTGIELVGSLPGVPLEKNLVYRATQSLLQVSDTCGVRPCGVRIHLSKKIPMGGGLGGGSSNAATVLKGCNALWGLKLPLEKLIALGTKLGADVPFFLVDGPAQVEGIGDCITPLENFPKLWIILINPCVAVPTPWAYSAWDTRKCQAPLGPLPQREPGTFSKGLTVENRSVRCPRTFEEVVQVLHNDFEAVVVPKYPEIARAQKVLREVGASGVLMSGSGSTVFGLFETKRERDEAFEKLPKIKNWQVWAVENIR